MEGTILVREETQKVEDMVRLAFHDYWDVLALAQSPLARSPLVEDCLLAGDAPSREGGEHPQGMIWAKRRNSSVSRPLPHSPPPPLPLGAARGMAVRVMLDWGLGQLAATGKERERERVSYEVLMKRYVEGLSNSKYADLMFIADDTAHARRKSAIGKLTKILQKEEQAPAEGDKRKQALIRLRYGACNEGEQRLLRLLAIFPTLVAKELLIRIENVNVERDSWSLMSQNLLVMDQLSIQVGIHPEIRPYIVTLLTADEWQRWHLAASCYDEQEGKLMEALYHLQQAGEHERAAALLVGQAHELGARLPIEPLRAGLAEFERDTLSGNRWAQVKILAGRTAEMADEVEIAFSQYEQALGAEDQTIRAQAYYRLACLYEQRDIETAFIHYAKCQRLLDNLEALNSIELLANVHIRVAWLLVQHNFGQNHALLHTGNAEANLQQAETLLERVLLLLAGEVEQEWHRLRSDLHTTWATLLAYEEEPNPQMQHQHRWLAWQHAREAQDVEQMINTAYNLGTMYFWRANYAQAETHFKESRTLSIEAGNERMVALNHKGIGGCYFSGAADYEKAVAHYQNGFDYFKETGHLYFHAAVSYDLAEAHLLLGNTITAKEYFDEGLTIAKTSGYERLQAEFERLGQTYIELTFDLSHKQQRRQLQAIELMRQTGQMTNRQYKKLLNCAHKTAAGDLGALVKRGICVRVGKARGTRYELVG